MGTNMSSPSSPWSHATWPQFCGARGADDPATAAGGVAAVVMEFGEGSGAGGTLRGLLWTGAGGRNER